MKKSQWNALWKQTIAGAVKEKTVAEDGITMQNYYDERDNVIASCFPVTKAYKSQKIFQYSYDEHNRLTQMLTLDMGKESLIIQYHYSENKLCKSLHYDNRCTDSKLRLKTIHEYKYEQERLVEEKVTLASGDISYYRCFSQHAEQIINPFRTNYSWTLDSVEDDTLCIYITEKEFTPSLFSDMIVHLHKHYPECTWIIIDHFAAQSSEEDCNLITQLLHFYEKKFGITIYFG